MPAVHPEPPPATTTMQAELPRAATSARHVLREARAKMLFSAWFSSDTGILATGSLVDKEVALWDLSTGFRWVGVTRGGPVYWTDRSPEHGAQQFAVAAGDGLGVYSMCTDHGAPCLLQWEAQALAGHKVSALSYSPDGQHLVVVRSDDGCVMAFRSSDGALLASMEGRDAGWQALSMHPMFKVGWQGGLSCSQDAVAVVSRCQTNDGSGEFDRCVKILSLPSLAEMATVQLPLSGAACSLSADGTTLAVGMTPSGDWSSAAVPEIGCVRLVRRDEGDGNPWVGGGHSFPKLASTDRGCWCLRLSPDAKLLACGNFQMGAAVEPANTFAIWDTCSLALVRRFQAPGTMCVAGAWSPGGDLYACGGFHGPLTVRELFPYPPAIVDGQPSVVAGMLSLLGGHGEKPAAQSNDELSIIASGSTLVAVQRAHQSAGDQFTSRVLFEVQLPAVVKAPYSPLDLDPTGRFIACVHKDSSSVSIRDTRTGEEVQLLSGFQAYREQGKQDKFYGGARFSNTGQLLAVCGYFGCYVFDATTGCVVHRLVPTNDQDVNNAAFHDHLLCVTCDAVKKHSADPIEDKSSQLGSGGFLMMTEGTGLFDLRSGESIATFGADSDCNGVAFNDSGTRLAVALGSSRTTDRRSSPYVVTYAVHKQNSETSQADGAIGAGKSGRERVRITEDRSYPMYHTHGAEQSEASGSLQWSPGDGRYLLASGSSSAGEMTLWDTTVTDSRQAIPEWFKIFKAVMLDETGARTMTTTKWVTRRRPPVGDDFTSLESFLTASDANDTGDADINGSSRDQSAPALCLQVVSDGRLLCVDITQFERMVTEDGNFAVSDLNRLSNRCRAIGDFTLITQIKQKFPFLINMQDKETGETVLHGCSRSGNLEALEAWLADGPIVAAGAKGFSLLPNTQQETALHQAIIANERAVAACLFSSLSSEKHMLPHIACHLTTEVVRVAQLWPRQLVGFVQLLEEGGRGGFNVFVQQRHVSFLTRHLEGFVVRNAVSCDEARAWQDLEIAPGDDGTRTTDVSVQCACELELLALKDFAGPMSVSDDATDAHSAFSTLFKAGSQMTAGDFNKLMQSRLIVTATQYKWQTFALRRLKRRLCMFVLHFALATLALLASVAVLTRQASGEVDQYEVLEVIANTSHCALLLSNSLALLRKLHQMWVEESILRHLMDGWHICDYCGIVALFISSTGHFLGSISVVQQVGALAVLISSVSLVQLLRPFEMTGPLIKIVQEIVRDIRGFIVVVAVLFWGFTISFALATASDPNNMAFNDRSTGIFPARGFVTVFAAGLGSFSISDFDGLTFTLITFLVFVFFVVIVMLNLLIAIMSDSYERVMEANVVEARKLRVQTILDEERMMSSADRANPLFFPPFLQVLRTVDPPERPWAGLSARPQLDSIQGGVENVDDKIGQLEARLMEQLDARLEGRLLGELKELKALLQPRPHDAPPSRN